MDNKDKDIPFLKDIILQMAPGSQIDHIRAKVLLVATITHLLDVRFQGKTSCLDTLLTLPNKYPANQRANKPTFIETMDVTSFIDIDGKRKLVPINQLNFGYRVTDIWEKEEMGVRIVKNFDKPFNARTDSELFGSIKMMSTQLAKPYCVIDTRQFFNVFNNITNEDHERNARLLKCAQYTVEEISIILDLSKSKVKRILSTVYAESTPEDREVFA